MGIIYTTAQNSDLDSIMTLLKSERGDLTELKLNQFIIAKDNENVIGCVRTKDLTSDCIELASLAVSPEYRGQGIGIRLVNEILEKDYRRPIYLLCMKDNIIAMSLS